MKSLLDKHMLLKFIKNASIKNAYIGFIGIRKRDWVATRTKTQSQSVSHCKTWDAYLRIMTSSNRNIFSVTGPLCGEFTGNRWIPSHMPVTRSFDVFFFYAWTNGWVNSRDAGDLRRHRAHYDVNVMEAQSQSASHCKTWDAYLRFVTNHTVYMYLCKCVLKAMLNRHSIFDMHK